MSDQLQVTRDDRIQIVRFNRPEKKNALTVAMYESLNAALREAEADPAVRVTLLCGSETCFTSGNDLLDFMQKPPVGMDAPVMQFLQLLPVLKKPLIAAVAGPAVGVGTTLLLHCDLVYAAANARFKMPFVSLGLVPEAGSTLLLPEIMGYARAAELLLLADEFSAEKALACGIVNEVVVAGTVEAKALDVARRLAAMPPSAVRTSKQLLKQRLGNRLTETILAEGAEFARRLQSPEAREAMLAFMQKRAPDFSSFE